MRKEFVVYYLKIEGENHPFYVGKTNRPEKRLVEHLSESKKAKNLKANTIKHAQRNGKRICLEVVASFDTEEETSTVEVALIAKFGRRDKGTGILCNHTDGGEGCVGWVASPESRKKMSNAKIGSKINVGRKRPDMIERFSKPVTGFDSSGKIIGKWSSARDAAKELEACFGQVSNCCLGRIRQTKSKLGNVTFRFGYYEIGIGPLPKKHTRNNTET